MLRSGKGRLSLTLAALGFILLSLASLTPIAASSLTSTGHPRQFVASSRLAVVRLVVSYSAVMGGQSDQVDLAAKCTGLGTIIATTGGANGSTVVLTTTQVVNPKKPCPGALATYISANPVLPTAWKLTSITAYLNSAYTGDELNHLGTVSFPIDISGLEDLPATDGPIVLRCLKEPNYDFPVLDLQQQGASETQQIIDMGNAALQPRTQDIVTASAINSTLTPVESAATLPIFLPAPTATPTITPTSTTPQPTSTPAPTATLAPTATAAPTVTGTIPPPTLTPIPTIPPAPAISLGAPVIGDAGSGRGVLTGIVVNTVNGQAILGVEAIKLALVGVSTTNNAGKFSKRWDAGLDSYYAAVASADATLKNQQYDIAATQFATLQKDYADFHGGNVWLAAAKAHSSDLGGAANAQPSKPTTPPEIIPGIPIHYVSGLITAGVIIVVFLLGVIFVTRAITLGRRRRARNAAAEEGETTSLVTVNSTPIERRADPNSVPTKMRNSSLRQTVPLPRDRMWARLGVESAGLTDVGLRRKGSANQDSIYVAEGARSHQGAPQAFSLVIVADGMGGHQFGQEASSTAAQVISDEIVPTLMNGEALTEDGLLDLLRRAVEQANETLHYRNMRQRADMGTTLTAALITGDVAHIANVGDSRTYHLPAHQHLQQITADHSVVASLVAAGVIKPDDIYTHPKRNQIYRSLGEQEVVQIDTFQIILHPGDKLLLCSDGLWEMVRNPRIEEILQRDMDLTYIARDFVDEANKNGGVDNISAIVVRVLDQSATPQSIGVRVLSSPSVTASE